MASAASLPVFCCQKKCDNAYPRKVKWNLCVNLQAEMLKISMELNLVPIPTTNRFSALKDKGISNGTPSIKKTAESREYKIKRVVILGDSHARNCAANLKQKVGSKYPVIGYVKPGAETAEIVKSAASEIKGLTKSDVIVVVGSTNDIGKNNAYKGIKNLKSFVQECQHTQRHDLPEWSIVNSEVKSFNQKIKQKLQNFNNVKC